MEHSNNLSRSGQNSEQQNEKQAVMHLEIPDGFDSDADERFYKAAPDPEDEEKDENEDEDEGGLEDWGDVDPQRSDSGNEPSVPGFGI